MNSTTSAAFTHSHIHAPVIHIVDDDAAVRRALTFLLEGLGWHIAEYASAHAFLAAIHPPLPPGCLVLDIRMPQMSGLELQRILVDREISLPIIMLTGHADVPITVEAMKLGAVDFIEKPFKDQVLLDAVSQAVRADLKHQEDNQARLFLRQRLDKLSPRETEIAHMLTKGLSNKAIGLRLDISERTVQVHRLHLMEKLGIHSTAELATLMLLLTSNESPARI